jgi:hypothetical protein
LKTAEEFVKIVLKKCFENSRGICKNSVKISSKRKSSTKV